MLQLRALNRAALRHIHANHTPSPWRSMDELADRADTAIADLRRERQRLALLAGPWTGLRERIDRALRTDATEYLDAPDFPAAKKQRMLRRLHWMNVGAGSYRHFSRVLVPLIAAVARAQRRPARLLELASGAGELCLALAKQAQHRSLPVEVTGSDWIPQHVAAAQARADARGIPARFHVINAFDMRNVEADRYDLIFSAQSLHHLAPGQLAMMLAQSQRVATTAFIGIDGYRSLLLAAVVTGLTGVTLNAAQVHDAWISVRKLYSEPELQLLAEIAAPGAQIHVGTQHPIYSVLTVRFDRAATAPAGIAP